MLAGLIMLGLRRLSVARVRAVTSPMDVVVWILLLVSVLTGIYTAVRYRFGSYWFTAIFTPYLWSILTFQPDASLVQPFPLLIKVHAVNFFLLLLAFPFSRLVHIIAYPLGYLIRPWQIVIYPTWHKP
jgi:nitrate reductase gamma subunit